MAEELKGLIEKIQQEGICAAEAKARQIQLEAERRAVEILKKARADADKIMAEGQARVNQMQESGEVSLQQSARDVLLALKKEISALLEKLILLQVRQALTPKELARMIAELVRDYPRKDKEGMVVSLKKDDLKNLEEGLFAELKEEIKQGIVLRAADDIQAGFSISFDHGRSQFDFTDKSLAEYIGTSLKPKLHKILGEATP